MTFGILTFHSQLNYGGVLQALALQHALASFGEVKIIDRWMSEDNRELTCGYPGFGQKGWFRFVARAFLGLGEYGRSLRCRRTAEFINGYLRLTPYHFFRWGDLSASERECVPDCLVVGSDQVWNCDDWAHPEQYLLEGAPERAAVSYAASFGKTKIPETFIELYKEGLGRFRSVSCREIQGVEICRSIGFAAKHVVDPTLLVEESFWHGLTGVTDERKKRNKKRIVVYLLDADLDVLLPMLEEKARADHCLIELFSNRPPQSWWVPFPVGFSGVRGWLKEWKRYLFSRVKVCVSAGPKEFLRSLSMADGVVSDSFHALMFSIIFDRNVRILKPRSRERSEMFSRIQEFVQMADSDFTAESFESAYGAVMAGAEVHFDKQKIRALRKDSLAWLRAAVCQEV